MKKEYYDGTKLLSLKDINGNVPEIYICSTNRGGGKTTYFSRLAFNRFFKHGKKFCYLYRYNYELTDLSEKIFKDLKTLFFPDKNLRSQGVGKNAYQELFIYNDDEANLKKPGVSCGYAVALNSANTIKKYSHMFSDVSCIIFDEFQSESGQYCPKEIAKFYSIHTSMARGHGEQSRYLPVYMISNPVSLLNPYYTALGISTRLDSKTNFLRGDGFVLEQGFVESASQAQKSSAFNRAFSKTDYFKYSADAQYLNDNSTFIEKPSGRSRYIVTLKYLGKDYAIREFVDSGIMYCDTTIDNTSPNRIAVTTDDHTINYVMLQRYSPFISKMRYIFDAGAFRFKNLEAKAAIFTLLSY